MGPWWSSRTPGERRLLILCGIVLVVGIPMMLMPSGGSTKKLLTAAEARQKYRKALIEKDDYDKEVARLQPEVEKLAYKEPPEQLLPQVMKSLQAVAAKSGIHIREIKPLRTRQLNNITRVPLSVRFTSEFAKSVPFLYEVEDPNGKLVVEKINVNAADAKSRMVDVELQIALFTKGAGAAGTAGTAEASL